MGSALIENAERRVQRIGADKPPAARLYIMQELISKYGTSGTVNIKGQEIPIINLPMMSDEAWQQLAARQKKERK